MNDQHTQNTDAQKKLGEVLLAIDQVLLDMQQYYAWQCDGTDPLQILQDLEKIPQTQLAGELRELLREDLIDDTGASPDDVEVNKNAARDARHIARVGEIQAMRRLFVDATSLNVIPMDVIKELENIFNMMIVWGVQWACFCEFENETPELERRLSGFKKYFYGLLAISPPHERDPFYPMDF
jgi:hypothetical protein